MAPLFGSTTTFDTDSPFNFAALITLATSLCLKVDAVRLIPVFPPFESQIWDRVGHQPAAQEPLPGSLNLNDHVLYSNVWQRREHRKDREGLPKSADFACHRDTITCEKLDLQTDVPLGEQVNLRDAVGRKLQLVRRTFRQPHREIARTVLEYDPSTISSRLPKARKKRAWFGAEKPSLRITCKARVLVAGLKLSSYAKLCNNAAKAIPAATRSNSSIRNCGPMPRWEAHPKASAYSTRTHCNERAPLCSVLETSCAANHVEAWY